jgi:hypothetical protein
MDMRKNPKLDSLSEPLAQVAFAPSRSNQVAVFQALLDTELPAENPTAFAARNPERTARAEAWTTGWQYDSSPWPAVQPGLPSSNLRSRLWRLTGEVRPRASRDGASGVGRLLGWANADWYAQGNSFLGAVTSAQAVSLRDARGPNRDRAEEE